MAQILNATTKQLLQYEHGMMWDQQATYMQHYWTRVGHFFLSKNYILCYSYKLMNNKLIVPQLKWFLEDMTSELKHI